MTAAFSIEDSRLKIEGALDFSSVVKLWKGSLPYLQKNQTLLIDLSNVTSANSAGLSLLIEWLKYAKREKKPLSFQAIPPQLESLAKMAGVSHLFS